MEERKYRCFGRLLMSRLWDREKWMILTLLSAIAIVFICTYTKALWFKEVICKTIDCLQGNECIIYTLAISYISGIIIYFLTVVVPETKRSKPILNEIAYLLQELRDEFLEMELELGIKEDLNSKQAISIAVETIKKTKKISEIHYSLGPFRPYLNRLKNSCEELTSKILNYSSELTLNELNAIVNVRNKKTMKCLKYEFGIENAITESELCDYLKGLLLLNQDIINLQLSIERRLFRRHIIGNSHNNKV